MPDISADIFCHGDVHIDDDSESQSVISSSRPYAHLTNHK